MTFNLFMVFKMNSLLHRFKLYVYTMFSTLRGEKQRMVHKSHLPKFKEPKSESLSIESPYTNGMFW